MTCVPFDSHFTRLQSTSRTSFSPLAVSNIVESWISSSSSMSMPKGVPSSSTWPFISIKWYLFYVGLYLDNLSCCICKFYRLTTLDQYIEVFAVEPHIGRHKLNRRHYSQCQKKYFQFYRKLHHKNQAFNTVLDLEPLVVFLLYYLILVWFFTVWRFCIRK